MKKFWRAPNEWRYMEAAKELRMEWSPNDGAWWSEDPEVCVAIETGTVFAAAIESLEKKMKKSRPRGQHIFQN